MPNTIVKLSRQYIAHDQVFDSVELREPTYADTFLRDRGAPQTFQPTGHGGVILITDFKLVGEYISALAVNPTAECLVDISALDAMRLQAAVLDFFSELPTPAQPPIGSSSDSSSAQT